MIPNEPYAYILRERDSHWPPCFPTLDDAMRWVVINRHCDPRFATFYPPVQAIYSDGRTEDTDPRLWLVEKEVDRGPIEVEVDKAIAADRERYYKAYPTPEAQAQERRSRCSGSGWLFERDREDLIRGAIERQRWAWKDLK